MAPAEDLVGLIDLQIDRQYRLRRIVDNARKSGQLSSIDGVQSRISVAEAYWAQFQSDHRLIRSSRLKDIRESEYIKEDVFGQTEELFLARVTELRAMLRTLSAPDTAGGRSETGHAVPAQATIPEVPLPRIPIPIFTGAFDEWRTFRDLFQSLVGKNASLADVHKLHYLKQHVQGDPERLLRHYPLTDTGYPDAWHALCDRYDNERLLVDQYVHALFTIPPMKGETAAELRRVLDRTSEIRSALMQLGRPVDSWDDVLVYRTVTRLDATSRRDWERSTNTIRKPVEWVILGEFLTAKVRELDAVEGTDRAFGGRSTQRGTASSTNAAFEQAPRERRRCPQCSKAHPLWECPAFKHLAPPARRHQVTKWQRCLNCLSNQHREAECPSIRRCRECGQPHHTLLHVDESASATSTATVSATSLHAAARQHCGRALLATARVRLVTETGRAVIVRALVDPGSEVNLISESVAQRLRVRRTSTDVRLTGATNAAPQRVHSMTSIRLESLREGDAQQWIEALILPRLTAYRPGAVRLPPAWKHLAGLRLADDFRTDARVEAVLGAETYASILLPEIRRGDGDSPTAQSTRLGWLLMGTLGPESRTSAPHCHALVQEPRSVDQQLRRFWELEELPAVSELTPDEEECERQFAETHSRTEEGRYQVRLPRKSGVGELGESRPAAAASLRRLERRLASDPWLHHAYVQFMQDYEQRGHMSSVDDALGLTTGHAECYYMPHHPVIKGAGTERKIRVVFNASQPARAGEALNRVVHVGPPLQRDLREVLLRWRTRRVAFAADIEQMYRQILVHPRDRPLQRIMWRADSTAPVRTFQLNTVTYGTACAPYLALRVLRQLALDEHSRYPRAAAILRESTYVDDILAGADSVTEALEIQRELVLLLKAGGFALRKWAATQQELTDSVPEDSRIPLVPLRDHEALSTPILGIQWVPAEDSFCYTLAAGAPAPRTKRGILSTVARLFDPLGWLCPVLVTGKILIQELWIAGVEWDQPLPPAIAARWDAFREALPRVSELRIPRWIGSEQGEALELHGFCDASERAYAAALYLVVRRSRRPTSATLLVAKSRVAPVQRVTLPRLELCGALLLARLMRFALDALHPWEPAAQCWSDSAVTLAWIGEHPARRETFVANRVGAIHQLIPSIPWRHVPTRDNPADIASRGLSAARLRDHALWWTGPSWLVRTVSHWPARRTPTPAPAAAPRMAGCVRVNAPSDWEGVLRASSFARALRIMGYVLRVVTRSPGQALSLSASELQLARLRLLTLTQDAFLSSELRDLDRGRPLSAASRLRSLNPVRGTDGLWRVHGRLTFARLPEEQRRPILLPRDARLTWLIVRDAHERTLHGGTQLTLATVRRAFWIPSGRTLVRRMIHSCVVCARHRAKPMTPMMAPLPPERATPSPPFRVTGVDYAGPIALTASRGRGRTSFKGYIVVFVCFATRAVHLELVSDYTAAAFLAAFHRFSARRGVPSVMVSDQGTTFVGADRELRAQLRAALDSGGPVAQALAADGTEWRFNPPSAPHFGGLWEAGVRSVKHHLRRVIGDRMLTFEELTTWLSRVEACLNSRPLSPLTDDPNDLEALTPGHFLIGRPVNAVPEPNLDEVPESRLSRWQLLQRLTDHLWQRWSREYLAQLQARRKWCAETDPPRLGELVVIISDHLPPTKWALGRIETLHPGPDGHVRVAKVRTADSILTRPLVKLVRLPVETTTPRHCANDIRRADGGGRDVQNAS